MLAVRSANATTMGAGPWRPGFQGRCRRSVQCRGLARHTADRAPSISVSFHFDFRHPNQTTKKPYTRRNIPELHSQASAAVTSCPNRQTYVKPSHQTGHYAIDRLAFNLQPTLRPDEVSAWPATPWSATAPVKRRPAHQSYPPFLSRFPSIFVSRFQATQNSYTSKNDRNRAFGRQSGADGHRNVTAAGRFAGTR
jgi:hypothetical protein